MGTLEPITVNTIYMVILGVVVIAFGLWYAPRSVKPELSEDLEPKGSFTERGIAIMNTFDHITREMRNDWYDEFEDHAGFLKRMTPRYIDALNLRYAEAMENLGGIKKDFPRTFDKEYALLQRDIDKIYHETMVIALHNKNWEFGQYFNNLIEHLDHHNKELLNATNNLRSVYNDAVVRSEIENIKDLIQTTKSALEYFTIDNKNKVYLYNKDSEEFVIDYFQYKEAYSCNNIQLGENYLLTKQEEEN